MLTPAHKSKKETNPSTSSNALVGNAYVFSVRCVLAPKWWNKLLINVRIVDTHAISRKRIKTHLFRLQLKPSQHMASHGLSSFTRKQREENDEEEADAKRLRWSDDNCSERSVTDVLIILLETSEQLTSHICPSSLLQHSCQKCPHTTTSGSDPFCHR